MTANSIPSIAIHRRLRCVLGLVGAALLGATALTAVTPALAQRSTEAPGVQTPFGRAPLSFADIVERVRPAVVSVHVTAGGPKVATTKGAPAPNNRRGGPGGSFPDLPEDHPLNEFFKNLPKEFGGGGPGGGQPPRRGLAQGSGFVISADGYVVTNNHVIDGATKIQVSFDEQNKHDAELIGTDARTDVALLKIKGNKTFPHVKFASKPVRVGDWVLAVGNPFGLGGTVTAGIVSALGRDIGSGPYDFLQIDAAVNRGNSGGPTFNLEGEVVGVNTAIYSPSGGNVGIAFAVPAKTANEVIEQLRTNKTVSRGWLGVKIENIDEDKAASLGMGEVQRCAHQRGHGRAVRPPSSTLKAGDVVLSVNGAAIDNSRDLARKIAEFAPNTTVEHRSAALRQDRERRRQARHVPGRNRGRSRQAGGSGVADLDTARPAWPVARDHHDGEGRPAEGRRADQRCRGGLGCRRQGSARR